MRACVAVCVAFETFLVMNRNLIGKKGDRSIRFVSSRMVTRTMSLEMVAIPINLSDMLCTQSLL